MGECILAIDNLDIVAAAGGVPNLYVVSILTTVSDGFLTIEFIVGTQNPSINAIEILSPPTDGPVAPPVTIPVATPTIVPTTAPVTPSVSIRINSGGGLLQDSLGRPWIADKYSTTGGKYLFCPADIAGTVDDDLYCGIGYFTPEREALFVYNISVPALAQYEF